MVIGGVPLDAVADVHLLMLGAHLAAVGNDDHSAIATAHAVECRCGRAFQNVHAGNVGRVHGVGRRDDPVDNVDGRRTCDIVHACGTTQHEAALIELGTRTAYEAHTGNLAHEGVVQVGGGDVGEFRALDLLGGIAQRTFLSGQALSGDHDVVERVLVSLKDNLELRSHAHVLGLHTQIRNVQCGFSSRYGEGKITICIGDGTLFGAYDEDRGTHDGLPVFL